MKNKCINKYKLRKKLNEEVLPKTALSAAFREKHSKGYGFTTFHSQKLLGCHCEISDQN